MAITYAAATRSHRFCGDRVRSGNPMGGGDPAANGFFDDGQDLTPRVKDAPAGSNKAVTAASEHT